MDQRNFLRPGIDIAKIKVWKIISLGLQLKNGGTQKAIEKKACQSTKIRSAEAFIHFFPVKIWAPLFRAQDSYPKWRIPVKMLGWIEPVYFRGRNVSKQKISLFYRSRLKKRYIITASHLIQTVTKNKFVLTSVKSNFPTHPITKFVKSTF